MTLRLFQASEPKRHPWKLTVSSSILVKQWGKGTQVASLTSLDVTEGPNFILTQFL